MATNTTVLENVSLVFVDLDIWSGQSKLQLNDFDNVDANDLPSTEVVNLGTKNLIDRDTLKPLTQIRSRVNLVREKYGTRLLGGYAIPHESVDKVAHELQALCDEFDATVDAFVQGYDAAVDDWIKANPSFGMQISRAKLSQSDVRRRFKASYRIYDIVSSARDTTDSLQNVSNELLDSLFQSVASDIWPMVKSKTPGQTFRVTVRNTLRNLAARLDRFAFADPSGGLSVLAADLVKAVEGEGTIEKLQYERLLMLLHSLSHADDVAVEVSRRAVIAQSAIPTQPAEATSAPAPEQAAQPVHPDPAPEPVAAPVVAQPPVGSDQSSVDDDFDLGNFLAKGIPQETKLEALAPQTRPADVQPEQPKPVIPDFMADF